MKNDFNSTYKRLTQRDENENPELDDIDIEALDAEQNALERLAELEDMIEDGGLLFAPVRIGDKIQCNEICGTCKGLYYSGNGWILNIDDYLFRLLPQGEYGYMLKLFEVNR